MLFQLKDFRKSHMFPVNTTRVLITCFHTTHGKFYLRQRQQATSRSPFVISSKTSPVNFTNEQIFFETADRNLTALTSCLLAFSGKQISEHK